jgi:hypothetical protein
LLKAGTQNDLKSGAQDDKRSVRSTPHNNSTPEDRSQRAYELLIAAVHLAENLLEQSPAATLDAKGGKVTAKRASDYFRELAAKRQIHAGGQPAKPN